MEAMKPALKWTLIGVVVVGAITGTYFIVKKIKANKASKTTNSGTTSTTVETTKEKKSFWDKLQVGLGLATETVQTASQVADALNKQNTARAGTASADGQFMNNPMMEGLHSADGGFSVKPKSGLGKPILGNPLLEGYRKQQYKNA